MGGFLSESEQLPSGSAPNPEQQPAQLQSEATSLEMQPGFVNTQIESPVIEQNATMGMDEVAMAERQALEDMRLKEQREQERILDEQKEDVSTNSVVSHPGDTQAAAIASPRQKDEVELEVTKILEEGIKAYLQELDPAAQQRFIQKGEEVSHQLTVMVHGFQVNVKKVLLLIRDWLLTIPRVNKFFLEQEAKIKTDRILEYETFYHSRKNNSVGS